MSEHWKDVVGYIDMGGGKREGLRQFTVHGDDNWVRWSRSGNMAGFQNR